MDNILVTPGVGATVAADLVDGALHQRVKLSIGADGTAADLAPGQVAMAASLPVAIANNQSAVPVSGTVTITCPDIVVTVTPAVDTSAYGAGDLLFDATEVAAAVRANGSTCILQSVTVLDKADQGVAFTLIIANAATDFGTFNAAPDPDDTEAGTIIGHVAIATTDYIDVGASKVACIRNIGLLLQAGGATTSLYIAAINGAGTPTYAAAGDLVLQLGLVRS